MDRIILAGDSLGGLFALDMWYLALKNEIRKPDAFLLFYPTLNLYWDYFSPCFLNVLDNLAVPISEF